MTILGFESIDVNGAIRGLSCNVLIEGIPCHALNVVVMLRNLTYKLSCVDLACAIKGKDDVPVEAL